MTRVGKLSKDDVLVQGQHTDRGHATTVLKTGALAFTLRETELSASLTETFS